MEVAEQRAILIVEDEPSVRVLLERVLVRSGHAVVGCATPEEALVDRGAFKLAIVDYSLPGLDGLSLIGKLRLRQPDLPVILCSGLPMNPPAFHPPVCYLQKPYRLLQIVEMVSLATAAGSR